MSLQFRSGTAEFKKLAIKSTVADVTMQFKNLMAEMSYYESIDSPAVSMTLSIIDGTDFKYSLPILGGETVDYSFFESGGGLSETARSIVGNISGVIQGRMRLYKLANDRRVKREVSTYDLFLTSPEMFLDPHKSINLAVKSMRVSDIVKQLFDDRVSRVGGKRLVTIDDTDGLQSFAFNGGSPFTAINQLASEAKMVGRDSSSYFFFYEDNEGYHFVSLETLFKKTPKHKYYYLEDVVSGDDIHEKMRLISMNHDVSFDILNGSIHGQFGTRSSFIDPVAKMFSSVDYTMKDFPLLQRMSGGVKTISDSVSSEIGSVPTREKYVVSDAARRYSDYIVQREPETQNTFMRRPLFIATEEATKNQLKSNVIKIAAHGNSTLRAGDVIEIIVPASGKRSLGEVTNKSVSGRYLITALCHRITAIGNYVTTMECVRDSFAEPLETGVF